MTEESQQPQPRPSGTRRRPITVADVAVLLAVLLVLLVTPLAALSAAAQPLRPATDVAALAVPANRSTALVRPLPAELPDGFTPGSVAALRAVAAPALGENGARLLPTLLRSEKFLQDTIVRGTNGSALYPYRYPPLTRLLDQAPGQGRTAAAGVLGAALLLVAAQPYQDSALPAAEHQRVSAAAAAFAVLDRARSDGDCTAQLNLLLLISADTIPRDGPVADEARRADARCPGDPTPDWFLGQYFSQRARVDSGTESPGDSVAADNRQQAEAAFYGLARRFPGSLPAITGAADMHLRAGLRLAQRQPFTGRQELRTAVAGYLAARDIDPEVALPGLVRAYVALGEPGRAVALLRPRAGGGGAPGPLLALLVTADEAAHDFGGAESTARDLAGRGPGAYPLGPRLFAVPGSYPEDLDQDPMGPQSSGTTDLPFTVDLQSVGGGAGGSVEDVSFIPVFRRGGLVQPAPDCPELAWRRDAILAGHAATTLTGLPTDPIALERIRPTRPGGSCLLRGEDIRDVARLETGGTVGPDQREQIEDERQNLFRWAGDLQHAEKTNRVWAEGAATAPLPMLRLGEVLFLQHRYDEAAAAFGASARRTRAAEWNNDLDVDQALLGRGASLLRTARTADGLAQLRVVAEAGEHGASYQRQNKAGGYDAEEAAVQFAAVAYHARTQMADAERDSGAVRAAVEDYDAARELLPHLNVDDPTQLRVERLDANQALADLALGSVATAAQEAGRALRADPMNPAFLMTAGFAADRAGQYTTAAHYDTAALASDPGAFPAANDLGVALAHLGRYGEAVTALRRAVGARPDYALGWFNLGVVYSRMDPVHFLAAQGALARAFGLDKDLRDARRTPTTDTRTNRTGLDLSKPLPARWSFARLPAFSPAPAAGLLAVLVLGLTLARSAAGGGQTSAQQWLETLMDRVGRWRLVNRLRHPGWAVAATVLVFVLSAVLHGKNSAVESVAVALGVLVLATVVLRSRALAARRAGTAADEQSWAPGIAFGLGTAALAPWAPLPVVRTASTAPRVHTAAPIALGLIGLVLFVESAAFDVPVIRALATAALIMVASVLVPVPPLDGAQISKAGLLAGAGAIGATVLLGLAVV